MMVSTALLYKSIHYIAEKLLTKEYGRCVTYLYNTKATIIY
jgi:hypothetical protein